MPVPHRRDALKGESAAKTTAFLPPEGEPTGSPAWHPPDGVPVEGTEWAHGTQPHFLAPFNDPGRPRLVKCPLYFPEIPSGCQVCSANKSIPHCSGAAAAARMASRRRRLEHTRTAPLQSLCTARDPEETLQQGPLLKCPCSSTQAHISSVQAQYLCGPVLISSLSQLGSDVFLQASSAWGGSGR